ncbi:related to translation initiation factor IF-2, mitochondrial [Ustilago trichophora]|uniref:Related to translation initiation factor IF-2, mitochondrial n=1 Tax=Ustilago trichophora TaxID=86804 RepID=A0A5C3E3T6_9BASI|nr:related to translation initiation factor IF-2, mitochondrial [Ustilago trichophora]
MLSRTSLSLSSSSRLASLAAASTSTRVTVAALSTPPPLSRNLSFTSLVASGRGGDRPTSSSRNNDRSDYRPRRRDDAPSSNQRSGGSNAGNTVAQYSRNQRFAPDGTRKRLPHPNAKPRQNQNQNHNQDRNDQRSPRSKDRTSRNGSSEGYSPRRNDESALKFGAASSDGTGSSSAVAAAKRDSTFSRLRARNASASATEDGDQGGSRHRDAERFGESGGAEEDAAAPGKGGDEGISEGKSIVDKSDRHHTAKHKKKEGRGSLLDRGSDYDRDSRRTSSPSPSFSHRHSRQQGHPEAGLQVLSSDRDRKPAPTFKPKLLPKVTRNIFLPSVISVAMLATRMEKKLRAVQNVMTELGMEDTRPDLMLKFEDAEMIAAELNIVAIPNDEASFDIYPRPPPSTPEEAASFPLRPPVVTIMGHVDHGKTTLLDKLRSTSVASGEAGGITQHIGAFSVPISGRKQDTGKQKGYRGIQTITFLDTPGHAAFTAMRGRGAMVTDIVVLVVAADDGVMPQTREVIQLVKNANSEVDTSDDINTQPPVQMVVALNKIDKPDADPERVKRELLAAGVELEELGGDIPCVHVSGKTGKGLDELEETVATIAELADLRAERVGLPEGYVIESKVDKGRGNVATVLVKRGVLEKGSCIIAGTAWCKVRQILHSSGRPLAKAFPGDPVLVTGWRELPTAGDLLLGGTDEQSCKKATENRKQVAEQKRLMADVEQINEARRIKAEQDEAEARREFEERQRRRAARLAADDGKDPLAALAALDEAAANPSKSALTESEELDSEDKASDSNPADAGKKLLNVIVKADYSGTVEAVVGAISSIGNSEAGVKIISATVGEPTEGDIAKASALGATIIGFNVTPSKSVLQSAARAQPTPVPVIVSDVIYRLMETVSSSVSSLLPPLTEARVQGEATISQIFDINIKGKNFKKIAGCKVTNGTILKSNLVRILRGPRREQVYRGKLDDFKHVKKDVTEMRKGTECGMSFDGWQDLKVDDVVQSFTEVTVPRTL